MTEIEKGAVFITDQKNENLPGVIDLFCGCGGLAAGFQKAGFRILAGMDINQQAVQTASYNLHWRYGEESCYECLDITETDTGEYRDLTAEDGCIVIGGPPCQAYSLAGRAKLRSLGKERENINDKRGYLYQDFLRFATELNASAVIMENVPESTNYGGKNVPEEVCIVLEENGFLARWTLLNAADYGVPQKRERVFVIAVKRNLADHIVLPMPTHCSKDTDSLNFSGRIKTFAQYEHFAVPNKADESLPRWNTVKDAISDLPVLFTNPRQKYSLGRIVQTSPYSSEPTEEYQQLMRSWYGKTLTKVTGNIFRKTLRDFPIFERMEQGDDYSKASEIADQILAEKSEELGISEETSPEEYKKLKKSIVPPYDRNNFLYKWTKLSENEPSHTLVAHLSVDTYSHIHPTEPRGISVREAARLQSFPDDFLFQTTMGDAYKQIGNAVPPLVALALAKALKETLLDRQSETDCTGEIGYGRNNSGNSEVVCQFPGR